MSSTPLENRLVALLRQHGVDRPPVSGSAAWSAFKAFGREVLGSEGIGLLLKDLVERRLVAHEAIMSYKRRLAERVSKRKIREP